MPYAFKYCLLGANFGSPELNYIFGMYYKQFNSITGINIFGKCSFMAVL